MTNQKSLDYKNTAVEYYLVQYKDGGILSVCKIFIKCQDFKCVAYDNS
jgi:hypothetical protein